MNLRFSGWFYCTHQVPTNCKKTEIIPRKKPNCKSHANGEILKQYNYLGIVIIWQL